VPFYILSAKYGLLHPNDLIEPYEQTLKTATKKEKQDWAQRVDKKIRELPRKKLVCLLETIILLHLSRPVAAPT